MGYPALLYRHTLDQEAFEALNHFPRFIGLCEAYIANVDEVAAKIDLLSKAISGSLSTPAAHLQAVRY